MVRSRRQNEYLRFRDQFPFFVFEKQEFSLTPEGLDIRYTFNLADKYWFHPSLFIPRKSFFMADDLLAGHLDNIVFNLGMAELVSYWKAACPPIVIIRPYALMPEQVLWWKKLYFNGLGEFFYLNSIDVTQDTFMHIEIASEHHLSSENHILDHSVIIPVGGGKDSAVTLELLGNHPGSLPLIMNPRGASLETIAVKGFTNENFIEIKRRIDPELLKLNDLGFLNGHTPFSALLAFVTVLSSILTGRRHIALSNESSASEATIEGTTINHQYSKSFQFETDFRAYVRKWISRDVNYFSFLRPLNELQIASLFTGFQAYHPVFKSCNAGSKTDSWCGKCAKCLFTYCILSPFLSESRLVAVFGTNLFDDVSLLGFFKQLTGIADEKPFDCVGTINEVNLALCETLRKFKGASLPLLLGYYSQSESYTSYSKVDFKGELLHLSMEHHLLPEFWSIIEGWMKGVSGETDR